MVHMPAHIYYRLGRWKDSIRVNIDAARKDEAYIQASGDKGFVRYGYYPHNVHFIVTSAQMGGDLPTAIREAKRLASIVDADTATQIAWVQAIYAAPYFATLQFAPARGGAGAARARPAPRLCARRAPLCPRRRLCPAEQRDRLRQGDAELNRIRQSDALKPMVDQGMPAPDLLATRRTCRAREISPRFAGAICRPPIIIAGRSRSRTASPTWSRPGGIIPVNQSLGAALYRAGRYDEAQQAFTAALAKFPNNGWALYGLAASEQKRSAARASGCGAMAALDPRLDRAIPNG